MIRLTKTMMALLAPRHRRRLPLVLGLMALHSVAEVAGVGMVLPLIQAVVEPDYGKVGYLAKVMTLLGLSSREELILVLAVAFVAVMLVKNAIMFGSTYAQALFARRAEIAATGELMRGYLAMDWARFVGLNSSQLITRLLEMAPRVFTDVLLNLLRVVAELAIIFAVGTSLLLVQPAVTMIAVILGGVTVWGVHRLMASRLSRLAEERLRHLEARLKLVQESIGGLKDARILCRTSFLAEKFDAINHHLSRAAAAMLAMADLRRASVEITGAVVMAGVLAGAIVLGLKSSDSVAFLSMFAVAMLRLMPSGTRVLMALHNIVAAEPSLNAIAADFPGFDRRPQPEPTPLPPLERQLECRAVEFSYAESERPVLAGINLAIKRGEFVGLVGPSGAGKSTLADIMMGMLTPTSGSLLVDGVDVTADPRRWQRHIGHVPQAIFLLDDTLRRNIAFCLPDQHVDEDKVLRAVRQAGIEEFIDDLPLGLDTLVGERGVRLSGGQRQRIAIARALYNDPDVLVLDEATSALDNETERRITEAIVGLRGRTTLIVIAHRLSTLRDCDRIIYMESGQVSGEGPFDDLRRTNPSFGRLVKLAEMNDQGTLG